MNMEIAKSRAARRIYGAATSGAATIAASAGILGVLRIVSSMTLTRLLDSHAYGVVAVVSSISFMIAMITEVGLYAFIVRHNDGEQQGFLDEVWTIRLLRGFALTALMAALSLPAASLLGKAELAPVLAIWSISFAIDGLSSLSFATSVREQKLWRLSMLDIGPGVVTFIMSVSVAFVWRSYWALIIGTMGGAIFKAYLSYAMFPGSGRRFRINLHRSRELWNFSRYIAASSFLSLLIKESDKVVLAKIMPLSVFGFYSIAVTLASSPDQIGVRYATRVLFAKYSKTARTNPGALSTVLYSARRKVTLLYMFAVSMMITGAPVIIEALYDPRYRSVVPYLQLLCISTVLRMPVTANNQLLIADGKTRSTLYANIFRIIWLAIGGLIALATGQIMLLVVAAGTIEIPAMFCFWIGLARARMLSLREEAYGFAAAAAGLVVGLLVNALAMPFVR